MRSLPFLSLFFLPYCSPGSPFEKDAKDAQHPVTTNFDILHCFPFCTPMCVGCFLAPYGVVMTENSKKMKNFFLLLLNSIELREIC